VLLAISLIFQYSLTFRNALSETEAAAIVNETMLVAPKHSAARLGAYVQ
jgi:hypothetical protein